LLADGVPVPLSSRAFDILLFLVELRDRVVTKDEILERVWHGTIVEENNLSVQVSGLRRALGEKSEGQPFIITIPGRGYRFVGQVAEVAPMTVLPAGAATPSNVLIVSRDAARSGGRAPIDRRSCPGRALGDPAADERPPWRRRPGAFVVTAGVATIVAIVAAMVFRSISRQTETDPLENRLPSLHLGPAAAPVDRRSALSQPQQRSGAGLSGRCRQR